MDSVLLARAQFAANMPFGILFPTISTRLGLGVDVLSLPSFGLMVVGSDLRARSEEKALAQAFGSTYTAYCERTHRFIPGVH